MTVAGVAAVVLWLQAGPTPAPVVPAPAEHQAEAPAPPGASEDLTALTAELARVHAGNVALEQRTGALQRELRTLHARLTQVDQAQAALGQALTQRVEAGPTERPAADLLALTPADAHERADAQAQVEVLEGTMRAEPPDPQWAPTAEVALRHAWQGEVTGGLDLVEAACGTTLCRVTFTSPGAGVPADRLPYLLHLAPWPGLAFFRVDGEAGEVVVYLVREGYDLPHAGR
jgi:hypothetical protein